MVPTCHNQPSMPRVLIADDQQPILDALELVLAGEQWTIEQATSVDQVLEALRNQTFDVALLDLNYSRDTTSGREGLDLLSAVHKVAPLLPVVVMTAWSSVEVAVEAMRRGAKDYVEKPWKNQRLLSVLRTQLALGQALRRARKLEQIEEHRSGNAPEMIANAPAMAEILEVVARVGPSMANVLITGEHGTGKEVLAKQLHRNSTRAHEPLVIVNAGGLADGVFDSELFGHVKGAFTDAKSERVGFFELADGGTIFLDEIGNMPPTQQAKLLRVLQTGEFRPVGSSHVRTVDTRVMSATNTDLVQAVRGGHFREDLLYRLNTIELRLPPLRERTEDLSGLALGCLRRCAEQYQRSVKGFTPEAEMAMLRHRWPGNIRELEHAVERGVLMARGELIDIEDLGLRPVESTQPSTTYLGMTLDEVERRVVTEALARVGGNVTKAATALGLSRAALYRRLERFDLRTD